MHYPLGTVGESGLLTRAAGIQRHNAMAIAL